MFIHLLKKDILITKKYIILVLVIGFAIPLFILWRVPMYSHKGGLVRGKGEELRTTKADAVNHGIGIPSVRRTAEKYRGVVAIDSTEERCFVIRVVLYGIHTEKVT